MQKWSRAEGASLDNIYIICPGLKLQRSQFLCAGLASFFFPAALMAYGHVMGGLSLAAASKVRPAAARRCCWRGRGSAALCSCCVMLHLTLHAPPRWYSSRYSFLSCWPRWPPSWRWRGRSPSPSTARGEAPGCSVSARPAYFSPVQLPAFEPLPTFSCRASSAQPAQNVLSESPPERPRFEPLPQLCVVCAQWLNYS